MIKQITLDNLDEISKVVEDFQKKHGTSVRPFMDQLKDLLSQQARSIFALYDQMDQAIGYTTIDPSEGEIKTFFIQNSIKEESNSYQIQERKLFDAAFTYLKNITPHIRIGGDIST
ncbi:MAG: hypothetical protein ACFFBD_26140, partial [Candidatus Hodarchaeota archaeon]